ncbi:MAG: Rhs element Vgr protein, partial [Bacteroidota bacterium]
MISLDIPPDGGGNLPSYRIFSNGTELSTDFVIQSMMVSRKVNKIPTARLVLLDGSIPQEDFATSNGPDLAPGAEVEIQMGYRGEDETVFK